MCVWSYNGVKNVLTVQLLFMVKYLIIRFQQWYSWMCFYYLFSQKLAQKEEEATLYHPISLPFSGYGKHPDQQGQPYPGVMFLEMKTQKL